MTQVCLGSNQQPETVDDYFLGFHRALLAGDDCPPVWMRYDPARRVFELRDGRKRFAAHILAGRPTILAVVEAAPPHLLA